MSNGELRRRMKRKCLTLAHSLLTSRSMPILVALLAVLFTLPALGAGWIMDDYYHRSVLLAKTPLGRMLGPPESMFRFFRGEGDRAHQLIDMGLFPWWSDPGLKAEFLQAITVWTHRLDYVLWPDSPVLMHAHNLFWLGTAVAATAFLYRRMFGATVTAGLAALLFALDDARGATVGFLANRNALVAATFGVTAIIAHDRWRRDGARIAAALAPALLLGALCAKEEGIGICAYFGAYAISMDSKGPRRGLLALAPSVLAVLGWRTLRDTWGYGVQNVGLYIDPLTDPVRFVSAAVFRIPMLLLGQWTLVPADAAVALEPWRFAAVCSIGFAFLAPLLFVLWPVLRRDRLARFWGAGMLFATVPVSATLSMDRLLTFVGIGASGLLAQFLVFALCSDQGPRTMLWRLPATVIAWLFVLVHLIIAPIVLPFRAANPIGPAWIEQRFYVDAPLPSDLRDRTVVIVNAPSPVHASYVLLTRELRGEPVPKYVRVLAPAIPAVTVNRIDERTLAVQPNGGYLRWALDRVFRNEYRPLRLGQQIRLPGMIATVTALTTDGRPADVTFQFDEPLESGSFIWLCYRGDRFEKWRPPRVGQSETIRFDWKAALMPPSWVTPRSGSSPSTDRSH